MGIHWEHSFIIGNSKSNRKRKKGKNEHINLKECNKFLKYEKKKNFFQIFFLPRNCSCSTKSFGILSMYEKKKKNTKKQKRFDSAEEEAEKIPFLKDVSKLIWNVICVYYIKQKLYLTCRCVYNYTKTLSVLIEAKTVQKMDFRLGSVWVYKESDFNRL